jgi:hypothetical protein
MLPASITPRTSLLSPLNNWSTVLQASIDLVQTSIPVRSKTANGETLPASGVISIDNEPIFYASIDNSNPSVPVLTGCVRGSDGHSVHSGLVAAHTAGAKVELRWTAGHHNTLADHINAIETTVGVDSLDAEDQYGLGQTYANLAAKLAATLPKIVVQAASSTTWTVTHNRGRIVSVQTWVFNTDHYDVGAPISMRQDVDPYGTSTVTIEFGLASTGYVVII